jgi:hypothetical protein
MRKTLISLLMTVMTITAAAQTVGDKMFIYYGGRVSDGFIPSEIDSIVYSNYDNDSIWYDDVVTQVIYTPDSVYRFPLAQIDSISFVRPATIYKSGAIVLEGEIRQYITSTDGFNLTLAPNTPSRLIPQVGDRLVTMNPDDSFPYYFAGEVRSAAQSGDGILLTCDTLEFEDVVEQFADIICARNLEEESSQISRKFTSAKPESTPWLPLPLPSFSNTLELSDISIQPIPKIRDIEPDITFGAGMTYSIEPQARVKITWFIKGGLFLSGIMVIDNSFSWSHHFNGEVSGNVEKSFLKSPIEGHIGTTPFNWYVDAGWFASLSGGLVWESTVERKTRTTLAFIYDRVHPENNMARRFVKRLPVSDDISGRLYGDINAEAGVYVEAGVSLVRKYIAKVGVKASVGFKGEAHNLRLWEGITTADKSPVFYDNIKDAGITISPFFRLGGVWSVAEALPIGLSGDFLNNQTNIGQPVNFYAVPSFDDVRAGRLEPESTSVAAQASLGHQVLIPVGVGFTAVNSNGDRVSTEYMPQTYSIVNQIPTVSVELKNMPKNDKYRICPMLRLFGFDIMASPSVTVMSCPVNITNFELTDWKYEKNGFTHNNVTYDYCFNVAVTVTLEDSENVREWGYVYRDPNGREVEIPLSSFGTSYTDTRYAYFRNQAHSTVCLFGYVKYVDSNKTVYGEPEEYPLDIISESFVGIGPFMVTDFYHKKGGFSHEGKSYDYRYDFDFGIGFDGDNYLDIISDWGYAYEITNGNYEYVSMMNSNSFYQSASCYRNERQSAIEFITYVKFKGEDEMYISGGYNYWLKYGFCPDENHPHAIDFGLPSGTKWACCDVGASKPQEYGEYYAWGETEVKEEYDIDNYKYCTIIEKDDEPDEIRFDYLGDDIAGTSYDVAHVKWGGEWRMPTKDQIKELINIVTSDYPYLYEKRKFNGVEGLRIYLGEKSIFLPGIDNRYWSSTQDPEEPGAAYSLYYYDDIIKFHDGTYYDNYYDEYFTDKTTGFREEGFCVRPVSK